MKNTLGFWGIVLFLIFNSSYGNRTAEDSSYGNRTTEGCGNKSDSCKNICDICDSYFDLRIACYHFLIHATCFETFNKSMSTLNAKEFCQWNSIKSPYDNFTICTEERADCLLIPWPNKLVENMFVEIHSNYFKSCPTQGLDDPPPSIVFALVMTPICLIPVMVVVVVMKTKNGDRRS
ncbi:receptor activity-modifying protein 1-like isoform X2 [Conger conger]|uniref:receptor activity-modifying protein 1-like isoform X2 n=1 Tax=Conger conger TaxID=82655 RepID=UPI002A59BE51|nr:receptor activity-modifying protein 1-like isoform X2 [Conger conger]